MALDVIGNTVDEKTATDLYSTILANGYVPGTRIRLISCWTGVQSDGIASQLSRLAGAW
jgi:hypothetical protein